jgi:hypothetical protein
MEYPLYDVPWLVREPNNSYMSVKRHRIELKNQAVVDDYFLSRANGASAHEAREAVGIKHGLTPKHVHHCLRWYYQEAVRRNRYDFLIKFPPAKEHIVHF